MSDDSVKTKQVDRYTIDVDQPMENWSAKEAVKVVMAEECWIFRKSEIIRMNVVHNIVNTTCKDNGEKK